MGTVCTKRRPLFSSVQQCYAFVEEVDKWMGDHLGKMLYSLESENVNELG